MSFQQKGDMQKIKIKNKKIPKFLSELWEKQSSCGSSMMCRMRRRPLSFHLEEGAEVEGEVTKVDVHDSAHFSFLKEMVVQVLAAAC
jgi:hypothetical protein